MNTKFPILTITTFLWCISSSKPEAAFTYFQTPFQAINHNSLNRNVGYNFGLKAQSFYTTPKPYIQGNLRRLYQVPDYYTPTAGYRHTTENDYHKPAQYEFHYNVDDPHHGTQFGHKEHRNDQVAKGQYSVLLPDGRRQIVDYVADEYGYRATIRYESGYNYK